MDGSMEVCMKINKLSYIAGVIFNLSQYDQHSIQFDFIMFSGTIGTLQKVSFLNVYIYAYIYIHI